MAGHLITAFEPFGRVRGHLLHRNASLDLLRGLQGTGRTAANASFALLPVSEAGPARLAALLESLQPRAVLCLGESGRLPPGSVHIEPLAVAGDNFHCSAAARCLIRLRRQSGYSGIGRYYCNRTYLEVLDWSRRPGSGAAVFVHVAVAGSRRAQLREVTEILRGLLQFSRSRPGVSVPAR